MTNSNLLRSMWLFICLLAVSACRPMETYVETRTPIPYPGPAATATPPTPGPDTTRWLLSENSTQQTALLGHLAHSEFGGALATGDVNGDGWADLIVGARMASGITLAGGEAYVIPGPLTLPITHTLPPAAALIFQGVTENQPQMGGYVASGDLNGDGLAEVVLGSWPTGQIYVYLGAADIQAATPRTIAVTPDNLAITFSLITPTVPFTQPTKADPPPPSMLNALLVCDLNGDGYQDLFVKDGQLTERVWGFWGRANLGQTTPLTVVLPSAADVVIQMPTARLGGSGGFNQTMACGDVDGDRYPDLAIGAPGMDVGERQAAGVVYVVRGNPAFTLGTPVTLTLPEQAAAVIEGTDGRLGSSGDALGTSLVLADVNQDGRADLLLGAPGASGPENALPHAGEVYLWLGQALEGQHVEVTSQAAWAVYGTRQFAGLGTALAAGDFDADGLVDVLLGCPSCEAGPTAFGQAYVLNPHAPMGMQMVNTVGEMEIVAHPAARCLGWAVLAADLTGDAVLDPVISAPCTDSPEANLPGAVYLLSLAP